MGTCCQKQQPQLSNQFPQKGNKRLQYQVPQPAVSRQIKTSINPPRLQNKTNTINENLGIKNLGNTCFMSCALQCLLRSKLFIQKLMEKKAGILKQKSNYPLSYEFIRIIKKLFLQKPEPINIQTLKQIIGEKNTAFKDYQQNDAIQFLVTVLAALTNQLKLKQTNMKGSKNQNKKQPIKSIIQDIFGLRYETTMSCQICHFLITKKQNTKVHFLPSPQKTDPNRQLRVQDFLSQFQRQEILKQDNMLFCKGKCQAQTEHLKKMKIQEANDILILGIVRDDDISDKRQLRVPLILKPELFIKNHKNQKYAGKRYVLNSAMLHSGTKKGGHYMALCCRLDKQKWLLCNDSQVSQIQYKDIRNELSRAYGLFYELIQEQNIDSKIKTYTELID